MGKVFPTDRLSQIVHCLPFPPLFISHKIQNTFLFFIFQKGYHPIRSKKGVILSLKTRAAHEFKKLTGGQNEQNVQLGGNKKIKERVIEKGLILIHFSDEGTNIRR